MVVDEVTSEKMMEKAIDSAAVIPVNWMKTQTQCTTAYYWVVSKCGLIAFGSLQDVLFSLFQEATGGDGFALVLQLSMCRQSSETAPL